MSKDLQEITFDALRQMYAEATPPLNFDYLRSVSVCSDHVRIGGGIDE